VNRWDEIFFASPAARGALMISALVFGFQQNPSNATKLEIEKLKREIETLYDEKVEGIIVRPRARWRVARYQQILSK